MSAILNLIFSVVIAAAMHTSTTDATQVDPQQVAAECMNGIKTFQEETLDRYAGNTYVNFMVNLEGDDETVARMQQALLRNFDYKIEAVEERNDLAVAKITVTQCDFSSVLKKYKKKSYEYVTEHLYDENITDKDWLNEKCLDIYVSQIEKVAKAGKTHEETIYLPLTSDGYNGWNAILEDDSMKTIIGDLAIPEYSEEK
ncbi:MAG: hypothetical protein IJ109_01940 [Firmicutes bacterium]|nr:hypothetical protein [Bacillota bacterium]